jgi:hypothetical protein
MMFIYCLVVDDCCRYETKVGKLRRASRQEECVTCLYGGWRG